jgi:hypothetical protein
MGVESEPHKGRLSTDQIKAAISTVPFGRMAAKTDGGSARAAGSVMTRMTAMGSPCAAATAPTIWDSMSIAMAPVILYKAALVRGWVTGPGDPYRVPQTAPGMACSRFFDQSSCVLTRFMRSVPDTIAEPMTQVPGARSGDKPPPPRS